MALVERLFGEHATIAYDRPLQMLFGANTVVVLGVALPATVLIPVGGALADVYGRKPLLVGGLLLFGGGGAGSRSRPTSGSRSACG